MDTTMITTTGQFKFATQIGQTGYYADVMLNVRRDPAVEGIRIVWGTHCEKEYHEAAAYGICYAWEDVPNTKKGRAGLLVEVERIRWAAVDTTSIMVVYAAAGAFWQALGHTPRFPIVFDPAARAFVFPR